MFGRTRRREAERFTRSVDRDARRSAFARSACSPSSRSASATARLRLAPMADRLMHLGDEATGRMSGVAMEFNASSEQLARHGEAVDRAAEFGPQRHGRAARATCRAPKRSARAIADQLRSDRRRILGTRGGAELPSRSARLAERTRERRRGHDRGRPAAHRAPRPNREAPARAVAQRYATRTPASPGRSTVARPDIANARRNSRGHRRPGRRRRGPG